MTDIVDRAAAALKLPKGIPPVWARDYLIELIAELVGARSEIRRLTSLIHSLNEDHASKIFQLIEDHVIHPIDEFEQKVFAATGNAEIAEQAAIFMREAVDNYQINIDDVPDIDVTVKYAS